jgi:hypothetical protein
MFYVIEMARTRVTFYIQFIYCFVSRYRIFHLYRNVTIAGEGCKIQSLSWHPGLLNKGDLYRTTPAVTQHFVFFFFWSHPKEYFIQLPLATYMVM